MKIGLLRHARVNYRSRFFTNSRLFDEGRKTYDTTAVDSVELKINTNDFPLCYVSSQMRAIETAKMVYPGKFYVTDELIEVSNAAFFLNNISIPHFLRNMAGRIAWFFNYSKMPETRQQSNERARKFISRILETRQNTLLITHGFFMHSLKKQLRKQDFKGRFTFFPQNATMYVFENTSFKS